MGRSGHGGDGTPTGATFLLLALMVPAGLVIAVGAVLGGWSFATLRDWAIGFGAIVALYLFARLLEADLTRSPAGATRELRLSLRDYKQPVEDKRRKELKERLSAELAPVIATLKEQGALGALARARLVAGMANQLNLNPAAGTRIALCAYLKDVDAYLIPDEIRRRLTKKAKSKSRGRAPLHRYFRDNPKMTDHLVAVADDYVKRALETPLPVTVGGNGTVQSSPPKPVTVEAIALTGREDEGEVYGDQETYERLNPLEAYLKDAGKRYDQLTLTALAKTIDAYGGHASFFKIMAEKDVEEDLRQHAVWMLQDKYVYLSLAGALREKRSERRAEKAKSRKPAASADLGLGLPGAQPREFEPSGWLGHAGLFALIVGGVLLGVFLKTGEPILLASLAALIGLPALIWLGAQVTGLSATYKQMREREWRGLRDEARGEVAPGLAELVEKRGIGAADLSRARLIELTLRNAGCDRWHSINAKLTGLLTSSSLSDATLADLPGALRKHTFRLTRTEKIRAIGDSPAHTAELPTKHGYLVDAADRYVEKVKGLGGESGADLAPSEALSSDSDKWLVKGFGHSWQQAPQLAAFSGYYRDGLASIAHMDWAVRDHRPYVLPDTEPTRDEIAQELAEDLAACEAYQRLRVPLRRVISEWRLGREGAKAKDRASTKTEPGLALGLQAAAHTAALADWTKRLAPTFAGEHEAKLAARAAKLVHRVDRKIGGMADALAGGRAKELAALTRYLVCRDLAERLGFPQGQRRLLYANALLGEDPAGLPALRRDDLPRKLRKLLPKPVPLEKSEPGTELAFKLSIQSQRLFRMVILASAFCEALKEEDSESEAVASVSRAQRAHAEGYDARLCSTSADESTQRERLKAHQAFECELAETMEKVVAERSASFLEEAKQTTLRVQLVALCAEEEAAAALYEELRLPVAVESDSKAKVPVASNGHKTAQPAKDARPERARTKVGRPGLAVGLGIAACAALVPAFLLLAPASTWQPLGLVAGLVGLLMLTHLKWMVFTHPTHAVDAGFAATLLALVFLGPIPAAALWVGSEVFQWLWERYRVNAFLANISSQGWAILVAAILLGIAKGGVPLALPTTRAYVWLGVSGIVLLTVNYFVMSFLLTVVRDGKNWWPAIHAQFIMTLPAQVTMTALAVGAVFLYTYVGLIALAVFAVIVPIPQLLIPTIIDRPQVAHALNTSATGRSALGLARLLGYLPAPHRKAEQPS